jgi:riboflavin-specific deaminase-like protein
VETPADLAWGALLAAARRARAGTLPAQPAFFAAEAGRELRPVGADDPAALLRWSPDGGWAAVPSGPAGVVDLLELYLPVLPRCDTDAFTVGHLGQSLDGFIATPGGDSRFVTGPENILHLHRMRALSDAVVVGAQTVAADDPRLTTRMVPGDSPVRVVLDPRRRLSARLGVFVDEAAPTLLVCAEGLEGRTPRQGAAKVVGVPVTGGRLELDVLLSRLRERGLRRLFVEGGGLTVSAFLTAGLLDRLQVTLAPLVIGEGRRGLTLPPPAALRDCLRPACRLFRMGADVLFDCDLRRPGPAGETGELPSIARIA